MLESKSSIVINKPIDQVYQYVVNPLNAPNWYENVKSANYTEQEVAVGQQASVVMNLMGKNYDLQYIISEVVPHSKFLMKAERGAIPMECEYLFKQLSENSTEVTIINRATPKGVPVFLVSMVKSKVQKTIEEDVKSLKALLESN